MPRILSSNKLLVFSLILFLVAAAIFLFQWNNYNSTLNYYGNNLLGNGFWLHPQNKIVDDVKKYETYKGVLSAVNRTTINPEHIALSIEPYNNSPIEEQFNFLMPKKVDLKNAYTFSLNDPDGPPVMLTQNLIDIISTDSNIEIELQSDWDSSMYQEVTKLIVRK